MAGCEARFGGASAPWLSGGYQRAGSRAPYELLNSAPGACIVPLRPLRIVSVTPLTTRGTLAALLSALFLLLVPVACGSDDGDDQAPAGGTTTEQTTTSEEQTTTSEEAETTEEQQP